MMQQSSQHSILRWSAGRCEHAADELAQEEPLEIRVRGRAVSITMRTPGHDAELAAGFLLSEGVVRSAADVLRVESCERSETGSIVNVMLQPTVHVDFDRLTRHVFASSSCGLCGRATIDSVRSQFPPIHNEPVIDASVLLRLPSVMRQAQSTFDRTGGLHAAALFAPDGRLIVVREDVGRHNAVDKVLGHTLVNATPAGLALDQCVLLVSGRSSFEIVQKALAGRIPIVAAVSAPSSLAVEFAEANNQTLVGFLRENRMNIYTHPRRIHFADANSSSSHA